MKTTAFIWRIAIVILLLLVFCPTKVFPNEKQLSHGSYMVQSFDRLQN